MKLHPCSVAFATTLFFACLLSNPALGEELTHEALVAQLKAEIQLLESREFRAYSIIRRVQSEDGPAFQAIPSIKPESVSDWERGHFVFILKSGEKITGKVVSVTSRTSHSLTSTSADPNASDLSLISSVTLRIGDADPEHRIDESSIAYAIHIGEVDRPQHGVPWAHTHQSPEWYFRNFSEALIRARIAELAIAAESEWEPFGEELLDWLTAIDGRLSLRLYEDSYLGQSQLSLYHYVFVEALKATLAGHSGEDWTILKSEYWKPKLERVIRGLTSQGSGVRLLAESVRSSADATLKRVAQLLAGSPLLSSAATSSKLNGLLAFDQAFGLNHGVEFISGAIEGPRSTRRTEALRLMIQLVDQLEPASEGPGSRTATASRQARATLAGVLSLCALTLRSAPPALPPPRLPPNANP